MFVPTSGPRPLDLAVPAAQSRRTTQQRHVLNCNTQQACPLCCLPDMWDERAKPILLGLVLAFMVGSYFKSEVYERGGMSGVAMHLHNDAACQERAPEEQVKCRASLAQVLVPVKMLPCVSAFHGLSLCENPGDGVHRKKNETPPCPEELQRLAECLQKQLRPYGFSDNEVTRLVTGKKTLNPQENPSLEVSEEGRGGEDVDRGERPTEGDEAAVEEHDTGGEGANVEDAVREEGKPSVEVKEEPGGGGDNPR